MRRFPAHPVVSVGAVVVDGERVLLAKRGNEPLKGRWSLPGGGVEIGETLENALMREVREETGLVVSVGPVLEVLDRIHAAADGRVEFHYVIVDYLCRASNPDEARAASDAADVRWAPAAQLEAFGLTDKVAEVIRKALAFATGGVMDRR
jgi:mutator protein MutT